METKGNLEKKIMPSKIVDPPPDWGERTCCDNCRNYFPKSRTWDPAPPWALERDLSIDETLLKKYFTNGQQKMIAAMEVDLAIKYLEGMLDLAKIARDMIKEKK